ncbi:MAG TPA: hypothetical protein VNB24_09465 [Acidimicrobiales bacterium]|nr:hypothetical protein [Acidimicrobiales bacterium]
MIANAARDRRMRAVAICVVVVVGCAPVVLLALGALQPIGVVRRTLLDNFGASWTTQNFSLLGDAVGAWPRWFVNSGIVVLVAVPLTVLVASLAGFVMATASRSWCRALLVVTVVALLVPASALWAPRAVLYRTIGVSDSLVALILPAFVGTSPLFVLLFALSYRRLPRSMFDAAELAGASPLRVWRQVAWPLGRPTAFAVGMLAAAWHWGNLSDALLYVSRTESTTVAAGLRNLASIEPANHPLLLTAALLATVPVVALFVVAHRALLARAVRSAT